MWGELRGLFVRKYILVIETESVIIVEFVFSFKGGYDKMLKTCSSFWRCILVIYKLVFMPSVKSLVMTYLFIVEANRDFEMAWNKRFVHTIMYRYLKREDPSNIRTRNTLTMTNKPSGGGGSSFRFVLFACLCIYIQTLHCYVRLYAYYHTMC